jgi:hypothetical protein
MEDQVLEGTLAEIQRQLSRLRCAPGKRLRVVVTEPEEMDTARLTPPRAFRSALEYLDSLPPLQRTPEEWAEIEREFQEERDSWDF